MPGLGLRRGRRALRGAGARAGGRGQPRCGPAWVNGAGEPRSPAAGLFGLSGSIVAVQTVSAGKLGWGFFFTPFLFIYLYFDGTSSFFRHQFAQCCSWRTV